MAEKDEKATNGMYVIGAAVLIAAILVSATLWIGAGSLQKSIGGLQLVVPSAAAGGSGNANGGTGAAGGTGSNGAAGGSGASGGSQAAPSGDWSFVAADPSVGPANASITVVEFADYQCPYCAIAYGSNIGGSQYDSLRGTAAKLITNYADTGKIRFVYHPMAFLGQESVDASNAAFCARAIGGDTAYFQMHDKLFSMQGSENSGAFSKANLTSYAAQIGLNSTAMASCISSGTYNAQAQASNSQADAAGVQGTPTFAVNNVIASDPEYSALSAQIDALLAK